MSTPPQGEGWRPGDPHGSGPPWQQGPWLHPPGPPPPTGNGLKWLLGAVAVLLVIAIAVGITVIVMSRGGDSGSSASPTGVPNDIASANDTGPVSVITDEPTCDAFVSKNNSLADIQANGWGNQRSVLGTAQEWTSDQRTQVEAVAPATRRAADQIEPLTARTPHRVVRELYQQFIAFGRAYADSVPNYTLPDNGLASANVNASSALVGICNSIAYGSAARSLALEPMGRPVNRTNPDRLKDVHRFITTRDPACTSFQQLSDRFNVDTAAWQRLDSGLAAPQWTAEQRAIQYAALPFLSSWASDMERVGRSSENAVLEDFSATAAIYLRAYVAVGDNYRGSDSWLSFVSVKLNQVILGACRAVAG